MGCFELMLGSFECQNFSKKVPKIPHLSKFYASLPTNPTFLRNFYPRVTPLSHPHVCHICHLYLPSYVYPIPLSLLSISILYLSIYPYLHYIYTTFPFMSYYNLRIPNIQVSNTNKNRHLTNRNDTDII